MTEGGNDMMYVDKMDKILSELKRRRGCRIAPILILLRVPLVKSLRLSKPLRGVGAVQHYDIDSVL